MFTHLQQLEKFLGLPSPGFYPYPRFARISWPFRAFRGSIAPRRQEREIYTSGHGMFPKKHRNKGALLTIAVVEKEDQRAKALRPKQDLNSFPCGEHPLDHREHGTENHSAMS